jgi:hypothetical protein
MVFAKKMNDLDRAAWKGFLIGVGLTVLTLAPFVLLVIYLIVHELHAHGRFLIMQ